MVSLRARFAPNTLTGSRARDMLVATAILVVMLTLAPRLRVYFDVTVVDVSVASLAPDGTRTVLATPEQFRKVGAGYWRGDTLVAQLKPRIDEYMTAARRSTGSLSTGTRYEWTVRWSDDSLKLDHVEQIMWEARDDDRDLHN